MIEKFELRVKKLKNHSLKISNQLENGSQSPRENSDMLFIKNPNSKVAFKATELEDRIKGYDSLLAQFKQKLQELRSKTKTVIN